MFKAAHVVRRFSFAEWGGTENVVWNSVRKQNELGIKAEIFSTSALDVPGGELRENVSIRRFPYRYPCFPMDRGCRLMLDKKGGNPWCPELFDALRNGNFDLIHVHCAGRLARDSVSVARERGIPCVATLHGGYAAVPPSEIRQMMKPVRWKIHYGALLDRLFMRGGEPLEDMDAIICLSGEEQALLQKKFPGKKIYRLPNGVDMEQFNGNSLASIRHEWRIPPSRKIILCTARIDYQKNQKILVELLRQTLDTHLVLIGPVTAQWYCAEILNEVRASGLEDRFTLIPGLAPGDARLAAAYREADFFILPSLHEPFGIAALEAWAWGIPLIASGTGGLKEIVKDGENGLLFSPGSFSELLDAWLKLRDTPGLKESLQRNGRAEVRKYEWDGIVRRQVEIYRELCGK